MSESTDKAPRSVLALCLGNICRSPIAEGLLRAHVDRVNLDLHIDSAGTSSYHNGEPPDSRSVQTMSKYGIDISHQRSRALTTEDFDRFDLILAMDQNNLQDAKRLAPSSADAQKVKLFLRDGREVPDPYYGGPRGFEEVYIMINSASAQWVSAWREGHLE